MQLNYFGRVGFYLGIYLTQITEKYNGDAEKMKVVNAYFGLIDSVIEDVIRLKTKDTKKVPFTVYKKLFQDLFVLVVKKELPNTWNEKQQKKITEGVYVVTELAKDLFVVEANYPNYDEYVKEVVKVSAEILYYEVYTAPKAN